MLLLTLISICLATDRQAELLKPIMSLCAQKKYSSAFASYKMLFQKSYNTQSEELRRLAIFADKSRFIAEFNTQRKSSNDALLGLNNLSDLTTDEFARIYLGGKKPSPVTNTLPSQTVAEQKTTVYKSIHKKESTLPNLFTLCGSYTAFNTERDGKDNHCYSGINQNLCGCCYAASIANYLQVKHHINNGEVVQYSPQQFIDCTGGNSKACCGGFSYDVLDFNRAFAPMSEYNYRDSETECQTNYTTKSKLCYKINKATQKLVDYKEYKITSYAEFKQIIYDNNGGVSGVYVPLSGSITSVWQNYKSGVMDLSGACGDINNNNIPTNHMVDVIGFGTQSSGSGSPDFITVRNSWGDDWGDQGTARISMDAVCGIGGCDGDKTGKCPHPTFITINTEVTKQTGDLKEQYGCLEGKCDKTICDGSECVSKSEELPPKSVGCMQLTIVAVLVVMFWL
ncbi:cysteine protease, putative [Entamoeba invadens IP1]|uniref:Cysteine protease, putative n=1 Tax=Entamoeba invadens IP1 TaxID=370355 RepID=L7FKF8_ENTIV|nr:cysteine protease, putative [Entamoeba invadens IP1]ELP86353.1 cysteine protease, putative [Entamoeba invadens IP1]|eukprot:XP_004185699.1 cysteine protease, putative [Entamoeba invadens IP1]